mmetsp:Transcript_30452/g.66750  ORF Transcript_30452/g.66750 Transcript_30452/m.66750 type:complete len:118 (-) Transcript_30452:791-1144(-)|eukprot:1960026-Pleurochrysis_carterae.AAC.1
MQRAEVCKFCDKVFVATHLGSQSIFSATVKRLRAQAGIWCYTCLLRQKLHESTSDRATAKDMQHMCKEVDKSASNKNQSAIVANQQSATANHTRTNIRVETHPHGQQQRTIIVAVFD